MTAPRILMAERLFEGVEEDDELIKNASGAVGKPQGVWYGVDTEWRDWCRDETPDWVDNYPYIYELTLDESRMILIRGIEEFDAFEKLYKYQNEEDAPLPLSPGIITQINWPAVKEDYFGIEIAPYLWDRRLEACWYYGWDVASGCLWHSDVVIDYRELDRESFLKKKSEKGVDF